VAHVDLTCRLNAESVGRALNGRLPKDIRILTASQAKPDFHARRSAKGKEYRYFVWNDAAVLPDKRLYTAHVYRPLDVAAMRKAAALFVGRHDFASFTANPQREVASTLRTVYAFTVGKKGKEIVFRVSGEGFLYKQVRSMVGFLFRVGEGAEAPGAVRELLETCAPRKARVPSAPAQGLFLWRVWYVVKKGSRVSGSQC
jgi:tRNA pseudouridine38-40 synthase